MKKSIFIIMLLSLSMQMQAKMVKQRITVLFDGQDIISVLYKESIESALMNQASVILEHGDQLNGDRADAQRFLAVTALDGLILGKWEGSDLRINFYSPKGQLDSLLIETNAVISSLMDSTQIIADKASKLYPELEQQVLIKDQDIEKTVSPLEYFRPQISLGLILQKNNLQIALTPSNSNTVNMTARHFSPGLMAAFDYRLLSVTAEFQLISDDEYPVASLPVTNFSITGGYKVDIRMGMWLFRGFLNLNLGLQYYKLPYTFLGNTALDTVFHVIRLYPHVRLRFTDSFMFGITGIGLDISPNSTHTDMQSIFQFCFQWDFKITEHLRTIAEVTMFSSPYKGENNINGSVYGVTFFRTSWGLNFVYQFNWGGSK